MKRSDRFVISAVSSIRELFKNLRQQVAGCIGFEFRTILAAAFILLVALPQLLGQGGTWVTKAPMPTARIYMTTDAVNGVVYAAGGSSSTTQFVRTLEAYDPVSNSWTTKTATPTARSYTGYGVVNGILYVVGGDYYGILRTVEAYDPASDTWTTKTSMPTARYLLGTCVVNGVIYAIGGTTDTSVNGSALATVEAYDPASDTWTAKASMPTARWGLGTAVVNGVIFAIGGFNASNNVVGTVEAYDPASNTWTARMSMPTARMQFGTSVLNGVIYAAGGLNLVPSYSIFGTVEAYDPASDSWLPKLRCPLPARDLGPLQ